MSVLLAPTTSPLRGTPPQAGGEFLRHRLACADFQFSSCPRRSTPKGGGGGSKYKKQLKTQ